MGIIIFDHTICGCVIVNELYVGPTDKIIWDEYKLVSLCFYSIIRNEEMQDEETNFFINIDINGGGAFGGVVAGVAKRRSCGVLAV